MSSRRTALALSATCTALLLAGLIPSENDILDTVSFFRPVFAVGLLPGLAAGTGLLRWGFLAILAVSAGSIWISLARPVPGNDLRLYAKNIRYDTREVQPVRDDIFASEVQVVLLQEVWRDNEHLLDALRPEFPHQAICGAETEFRTAILSKQPFVGSSRCSKTRGMTAVQIELDGQLIWLVSVHWPWPWPAGGRNTDGHMRALLERLDGAVVLAGDFNSLPWTHRMSAAARLTRARQAGPIHLTLWHRKLPLPLPLDYVLAPGGGTVEARPLFGSDHMGLVADVALGQTNRR